jgi:hypothetical protein
MLCILVDVADDFDVFLIRASITGGWPSIRTKVVSSTNVSRRCFDTVFFAAREVEDQDSGNLTLNHLRWRSFHQPSIRPKPRP